MRSGRNAMLMPPDQRRLTVWSQMPEALRRPRPSDWADINMGGRELGCFLEGPAFDDAGNLFLVDIPFGRILRVDPAGKWQVVAEYDGWPNGMRWSGGRLIVADHKRGLLDLDPGSGRYEVLFSTIEGKPLLGLNDLAFAPDGTLYVTDQGQSGLHAPEGCVLRRTPDGAVDVVLRGCPSPNGIVFDPRTGWLYVAMTRGNCVWRVPFVRGEPSKVGLAIQLSGGIGPDGLALDPAGNLLVVHAPIGVWQFDRNNLPKCFFAASDDGFVTNLAIKRDGDRASMFVTDSVHGRILVGELTADA
jgi:gluconolactonase